MSIDNLSVSTRQLKAFVALARLKNFTRAAEVCRLSQPAFSTSIRTLEGAVGARLFDRDTRKVELTAEGRLLLESATRMLDDLERTLEDLRERVARRRGRVAIALLPSLAAGWLPTVLADFRTRYPGIELEVADALSESCIERVRSGRADFALASVRVNTPELRAEPFCSDRFHLVCRRDHPLASRRRVPLSALRGQPFVHLASMSSVRQLVDAATWPMPLQRMMELEQLSTVAGMVRAGLGITLVPSLALFHFRHPELVTRALNAPGLLREIAVLSPRDRSLSPAAQALLERVLAHRPNMRSVSSN